MIGTTIKAGAWTVFGIALAGAALVRSVGPGSDLSPSTQIQLFVGAALLGAILTGVVASLRMVRAADMPLWTQLDQYGRKEHGFLNWWATLFAIWIVLLLVLFVFVPVLTTATDMLSGVWSDAG